MLDVHADPTAPAQLETSRGTSPFAVLDGFEQALAQRGRRRLVTVVVLATVLMGTIAAVFHFQDQAVQGPGLASRLATTPGGTARATEPARVPIALAMAGKSSASAPSIASTPPATSVERSPTGKPAAPLIAAARAPVPSASPPVGPSSAGEACSERSFLFRIPCVAQQCTLERYSRSQECLDFRELEQRREQSRRAR